MTDLLTAAQMREVEQAAMASGEVTGLELMERAGRGVVDAIFEEWPDLAQASLSERGSARQQEGGRVPKAVVLCGPGNNGGDGFVVAQLLKERGWEVHVLAPENTTKMPPDAATNRRRWKEVGDILPLNRDGLRSAKDADLYVDAVFGTGLTRPPEGELAELLSYLAGSGGDHGFFQPRMVAVDVPSGLCSDSGKVLGCPEPEPFSSLAPYARLTVTFETPKPGHFLAHGPELCGRLVVRDIGLTKWRSVNADGRGLRLPRLQLVPPMPNGPDEPHVHSRPTLRPKIRGHKFDHGHVLVLTGDRGATGAARLAARGALRMGAGLVTLSAPRDAAPEVAAQITALMLRVEDNADQLAETLEDDRIGVVCLGPGLGLHARAQERLDAVLAAAPPPGKGTYLGRGRRLVLDADALTLLSRRENPFQGLGKHVVLTPHSGEFARLFPDISARLAGPQRPKLLSTKDFTGEALQEGLAAAMAYREALSAERGPAYSKVDAVRDAAKRSGAVVLLKGADTVVALPDGRAWVHAAVYDRSAPWLATAGAGDVLAGFISGVMARGHMPHEAAILGAWLHVECARSFGPGLIAEDLPEVLPSVLKALLQP